MTIDSLKLGWVPGSDDKLWIGTLDHGQGLTIEALTLVVFQGEVGKIIGISRFDYGYKL